MELIDFVHWFQQHSILFMTAMFVAIVAIVYWPGRKSKVESNGLIPFREER